MGSSGGLITVSELPTSVASATAARVWAAAQTGYDPSGAADSATALTAALTAAAALHGGAGIVDLGPGAVKIGSLITVPRGVGVEGAGSSHSGSYGTSLVCSAAGSGVYLQTAEGGVHKGYRIDGNSVGHSGTANCVLQVGEYPTAGDQANLLGVDVVNGAQDNILIPYAQNHALFGCSSQAAARDNLVLDLGCGGLAFYRFESWGAGRYALRITQSSPTTAYSQPTHILFSHSIFEHLTADQPLVSLENGDLLVFDHCIFVGDFTGGIQPLINLANTFGAVEFRSCFFQGQAGQVGVKTAAGTVVTFTGDNVFQNLGAAIDKTGGGSVRLALSGVRLQGGVPLFSGATARETATGNALNLSKTSLTYSASITPDASLGPWQAITVTDGNALTINAPANPPTSGQTTELTIEFANRSGGAMGAITWNGALALTGGAFAGPANNNNKFVRFEWNGSFWVETSRSANQY